MTKSIDEALESEEVKATINQYREGCIGYGACLNHVLLLVLNQTELENRVADVVNMRDETSLLKVK